MSKVVFVGNVPYNMAEEQLIDVFKSAGQVVGFRLVYDRDTGKPKGYGFCEFADHETAASAVRNLNNVDVGGRALRIDLADSDPFLEGKTTVRGELLDNGHGPSESRWRDGEGSRSNDPKAFLAELPPGIPVPPGSTAADVISATLAKMDPAMMIEVLAQMKAFVITHPEQARALLVANPQYGYALFQALLLNRIVDPAVLQRMLASTTSSTGTPQPMPPTNMPPPAMPPPAMHPPYPLPPAHPYGVPPPMAAPPPNMYPPGMPPPMPPSYYRPPPTSTPVQPPPQAPPVAATPTSTQPEITESQQRSMLMQVLSLTPDQVNALPEQERAAIQQLRTQFMGTLTTS